MAAVSRSEKLYLIDTKKPHGLAMLLQIDTVFWSPTFTSKPPREITICLRRISGMKPFCAGTRGTSYFSSKSILHIVIWKVRSELFMIFTNNWNGDVLLVRPSEQLADSSASSSESSPSSQLSKLASSDSVGLCRCCWGWWKGVHPMSDVIYQPLVWIGFLELTIRYYVAVVCKNLFGRETVIMAVVQCCSLQQEDDFQINSLPACENFGVTWYIESEGWGRCVYLTATPSAKFSPSVERDCLSNLWSYFRHGSCSNGAPKVLRLKRIWQQRSSPR